MSGIHIRLPPRLCGVTSNWEGSWQLVLGLGLDGGESASPVRWPSSDQKEGVAVFEVHPARTRMTSLGRLVVVRENHVHLAWLGKEPGLSVFI